jgi:hypothetical protein
MKMLILETVPCRAFRSYRHRHAVGRRHRLRF